MEALNPRPGAGHGQSVPADFRFWTDEKLRNADTDQFKHVNNAAMATFFEAGRMEIFVPHVIEAMMEGANLAVVRLSIEFRAEVHFPGRVRIGSTVLSVGKTSIHVRQGLFTDPDDACAAMAEAVCVLVHPDSRRPHPVSAELRRYLLGERGHRPGTGDAHD